MWSCQSLEYRKLGLHLLYQLFYGAQLWFLQESIWETMWSSTRKCLVTLSVVTSLSNSYLFRPWDSFSGVSGIKDPLLCFDLGWFGLVHLGMLHQCLVWRSLMDIATHLIKLLLLHSSWHDCWSFCCLIFPETNCKILTFTLDLNIWKQDVEADPIL